MSLSSLIVQREVATIRQVEEALARQVLYGGDLATNVLEVADVPESVLVPLLAETLHIPHAPVGALPQPSAAARALVPGDMASRRALFPLHLAGDTLFVAVAEPLEQYVKAELSFALGVQIEERVAPLVRIREALNATYDAPLDRRMERLIAKLGAIAASESSSTPLLGSVGATVSLAPPAHTTLDFPAPSAPPEPAIDLSQTDPAPPFPPEPAKPASPALAHPRPKSGPTPVYPSSLVRHADRANRSARRRRGPLTFDRAKIELEQASDRDTLLDLFFDFSLQFFEYTALFVVHGDLAEGRDAYGAGAPRERVLGVGVPLDFPSAFSAARDRSAPLIAHPGADGLDAVLVQDLRRMIGYPILVVPVVVRGRTVALLYGDNGEVGVDGSGSGDVTAFASRIGQAFERIIVRRKLGGFVAGGPTTGPRVDMQRVVAKSNSQTAPSPSSLSSRPAESLASKGVVAAARSSLLPKEWPYPGQPAPRQSASQRPDRVGPPAANSWEEPIPIVGTEFGELPPPPQVVAIRPLSVRPIPREEPEGLSLDLTPGPVRLKSAPSIEASNLDEADEAQLLRELEELEATGDGAPAASDDVSAEPMPLVPKSSQAIAIPPHTPPTTRGRPESLPSVIVNVDTEFLALVDRLAKDAGDEHAEAELLRQGQHAMPAIMARFPGPVGFTPAEAMERGLRVAECGPILRLIAGQRRVALPFVLAQIDDPDADRRFWATFLLTELPYTEAVPAIVARLFDEHEQTRRVARLAAKGVAEAARETLIAELDRIVRDPTASQEKRVATMDALGEMRDALVVPVLIGALGDDVETVALASRRALMTVVRQDFGRDTRRWLAWWSSNSSRHRVEWLIDSLTHDHVPMRQAAAEELKAVTKEFFGYYEDLPKRERERAQQRYRDWWRGEGRARFRRG